ncbi:hypothetical protein EJD97_006571 [Solanum chilense]|uniref:Uncharacterized protein n=2 Tax=Solanum subgen. Lycopersicon TaxID=49274 RepID=A0A3Q7E8H5_SOLLC|nr:hypothetical protein EJD97_006571 [Solanum chilense]
MKVVQRIAVSFLVHLRYPGKSVAEAIPHDIDQSLLIYVLLKAFSVSIECVEEMMLNMPKKDETSPRLRHIFVKLVERCRCQLEQIPPEQTFESFSLNMDVDAFDNCRA